MQTALDLLPNTEFRPVTFVGQRLWDEHVRAVDQAVRHTKSPEAALAYGQTQVQIELDKVYNRDAHPLLPAGAVAGVVVGLFQVASPLLPIRYIAGCFSSAGRHAPKHAPDLCLCSRG